MKMNWNIVIRHTQTASFIAGMIIIFLLLVYSYNYISTNINTYIKSDGYYWVENVIKPFIENGFSMDQLFYTRSTKDHSQPLTKALYLLNTHFFRLDLRIFGVVGFLSLLMALSLLTYHYIRINIIPNQIPINRNLITVFIFIIFSMIFFNFNSTVQYEYELILVNKLYAIFIPIVFIILLDCYMIGYEINFLWIVVMGIVLVIVGNTNLIYILASLGTSILILLIRFNDVDSRTRAINLIILFIAVAFLTKSIHSGTSTVDSTIHSNIFTIDGGIYLFIKSFILALGTTVISINQIPVYLKMDEPITAVYFVGSLFLLILIITYFIYFVRKQYIISVIPIVFLIVYFLIITGIILNRGPMFGISCTLFPRYISGYNLIYIGLIWIVLTFIFQNSSKAVSILSILFLIGLISINASFLTRSIIRTKYVSLANNNIKNNILEAINDNPKTISKLPGWAKPKGFKDKEILEVQRFLFNQNLTYFAYDK